MTAAANPPAPFPSRTPTLLLRDVGDGEVGLSVGVEIAHGDASREPAAGGVGDGGGKSARAISEQDADVVAVHVGDGEVALSVAVEIAHGDRVGMQAAGGVGDGGGKSAGAISQQDADVVLSALATARSLFPSPLKSPTRDRVWDASRRRRR